MSSLINSLSGNGMSLQFQEFARPAEGDSPKDTRVVRILGTSAAATVHEEAVTNGGKVGNWFRSGDVKDANNATRTIFRNSMRKTRWTSRSWRSAQSSAPAHLFRCNLLPRGVHTWCGSCQTK